MKQSIFSRNKLIIKRQMDPYDQYMIKKTTPKTPPKEVPYEEVIKKSVGEVTELEATKGKTKEKKNEKGKPRKLTKAERAEISRENIKKAQEARTKLSGKKKKLVRPPPRRTENVRVMDLIYVAKLQDFRIRRGAPQLLKGMKFDPAMRIWRSAMEITRNNKQKTIKPEIVQSLIDAAESSEE